jgi:hypothetical protein
MIIKFEKLTTESGNCSINIQNVPVNVNPPRQDAEAAANELPGNELVTTQNIAVVC